MAPGAPATCRAAVRAIWLARPGTRVSKVSAGFRREPPATWVLPAQVPAGTAGTGWPPARATAEPFGAGCGPAAGLNGAAAGARGATASSSRALQPASSLAMPSMRGAYWARIQSSLKRFGTVRRRVSAPSAAAGPPDSAGGSGRIQVLNCCSGSSVASRSQVRAQSWSMGIRARAGRPSAAPGWGRAAGVTSPILVVLFCCARDGAVHVAASGAGHVDNSVQKGRECSHSRTRRGGLSTGFFPVRRSILPHPARSGLDCGGKALV
jgi:hypothetical protein